MATLRPSQWPIRAETAKAGRVVRLRHRREADRRRMFNVRAVSARWPNRLRRAQKQRRPARRSDAERLGVPGTGLEPARDCSHHPLKMACLPISPPGQKSVNLGDPGRARTCDPLIKSQLLCQLSYRIGPRDQQGHAEYGKAAAVRKPCPVNRWCSRTRCGTFTGASSGRPSTSETRRFVVPYILGLRRFRATQAPFERGAERCHARRLTFFLNTAKTHAECGPFPEEGGRALAADVVS